jgi:hypothetical protein
LTGASKKNIKRIDQAALPAPPKSIARKLKASKRNIVGRNFNP